MKSHKRKKKSTSTPATKRKRGETEVAMLSSDANVTPQPPGAHTLRRLNQEKLRKGKVPDSKEGTAECSYGSECVVESVQVSLLGCDIPRCSNRQHKRCYEHYMKECDFVDLYREKPLCFCCMKHFLSVICNEEGNKRSHALSAEKAAAAAGEERGEAAPARSTGTSSGSEGDKESGGAKKEREEAAPAPKDDFPSASDVAGAAATSNEAPPACMEDAAKPSKRKRKKKK